MANRGMMIATIAALALGSVSLSACRDGRPGFDSDRYHHRDRDRDRYRDRDRDRDRGRYDGNDRGDWGRGDDRR